MRWEVSNNTYLTEWLKRLKKMMQVECSIMPERKLSMTTSSYLYMINLMKSLLNVFSPYFKSLQNNHISTSIFVPSVFKIRTI